MPPHPPPPAGPAARAFPRRLEALEAIAAFVEEFLAGEGLDAGHAFDLQLVLEELFTNQVRHAHGGRDAVEIALARDGDRVELRLTDFDVPPFDPTAAAEVDVDAPIEARRAGGLGIHLVRRIAEDFRYHHRDGASTFIVTWRIPR